MRFNPVKSRCQVSLFASSMINECWVSFFAGSAASSTGKRTLLQHCHCRSEEPAPRLAAGIGGSGCAQPHGQALPSFCVGPRQELECLKAWGARAGRRALLPCELTAAQGTEEQGAAGRGSGAVPAPGGTGGLATLGLRRRGWR